MTLRVRQAVVTAALLGPLGFAIMTAPPFQASGHAAAPMRMVGPLFPIKVDSNGNGVPDPGDESVGTTLAGNTLTLDSRWHCTAAADNVVTMSNPDGSGRYQTASRTNGPYTQTLSTGGGAAPSTFTVTETSALGGAPKISNITLADLNGDGVIDQALVVGSVNAGISFSFTRNAQDISIPWAQASLIGVNTGDSCGGSDPQIWIPLADTNGDGIGDTVLFDLDGNGVPDPQFVHSPMLTPPAVPSMGVVARAILTLLLGATAAWFIARRSVAPTLTPRT